MIITIDGPSASGKSTVAQQLAQQLQLIHINSGYLYRGAAVLFLRQLPALGLDHELLARALATSVPTASTPQSPLLNTTQAATTELQSQVQLAFTKPGFLHAITHLEYRYQAATNLAQVCYQGVDLTPDLKTPLVSQLASLISAQAAVRAIINQLQRDLVQRQPQQNYIADGRDCGSVVFPQAELKIFLTASLAVRAARWCRSLASSSAALSLAACETELAARDQRDMTRAVAPLVVPPHAIVIDSSALTLAQVVAQIKTLILAHG